MTGQKLEDRVKLYISLHHEGDSWDFKRQWHDKEKEKADLLHDIICMANLAQDDDGLIIIGVDEENGYAIKDVTDDPNRKDTHELVKFLRDKPFDGGIRPMECRNSGKPIAVWCEEQGINIKTNYYWQKQVWDKTANTIIPNGQTNCSLNVKTVSKDVCAGHIKTHMAVRE